MTGEFFCKIYKPRLKILMLIILFRILIIQSEIYPERAFVYCVLKGTITDSLTMKPLRYVTVTLTGTPYKALSDSNGLYTIKDIPPGFYELKVSLAGYNTIFRKAVRLSAGVNVLDFSMMEMSGILPRVVVSADKYRDDSYEFIGASRLNNKELQKMPGSLEDVVRAVSVLPGIAQISNYYNDLIVAGGGPTENLYILDGIEVPNINHYGSQANTGGVLSFINMDYVSSVSFYSGGFSAEYGNKISSVMDIKFRSGSTDRFHGKAVISGTQFALNIEAPLSGTTALILSARRSYLDMVFKYSGFTFAPEYYDLFARLSSRPDNKSSLSVIAAAAKDKLYFFEPEEEAAYEYNRALFNDQTQLITGASYIREIGKAVLELSLGSTYRHYESLPNIYFYNNSTDIETNFNAKVSLKLTPSDQFDLGLQLKHAGYKADMRLNNFVSSYNEKIGIEQMLKDETFSSAGTYIQYDHNFTDRLKLRLGLRTDLFDDTNEAYTISPRLQAEYFITANSSLALSAGIYRQTPEYLWILASPQNRDLKSISCSQLHLEYDNKITGSTEIKLQGFLKKYSDYPASTIRPYLVMTNAGQGFSGVDDNFSGYGLDPMTSAGEGFVRGAELFLSHEYGDSPLRTTFSLTYSKAEFKALDGILRPGTFDQRWNFTFIAGYALTGSLEIDARFRYASGTPYTPYDKTGRQYPENYNTARIEDQHSLDLRIDKTWEPGMIKLRTYLDIQNIYNHKVRTLIRWDKSNKMIAEDPVLGIVPTIGISAEL